MDQEKIARVCHQVNKAYCESLGDYSQPDWDNAPDWQKNSVMNGVELHKVYPNVRPDISHAAWMANKLSDGWRHGPIKDPTKKEHPCMVPFSELPRDQQAKDFIFRQIVLELKDL